jgi:hypothetical protein
MVHMPPPLPLPLPKSDYAIPFKNVNCFLAEKFESGIHKLTEHTIGLKRTICNIMNYKQPNGTKIQLEAYK